MASFPRALVPVALLALGALSLPAAGAVSGCVPDALGWGCGYTSSATYGSGDCATPSPHYHTERLLVYYGYNALHSLYLRAGPQCDAWKDQWGRTQSWNTVGASASLWVQPLGRYTTFQVAWTDWRSGAQSGCFTLLDVYSTGTVDQTHVFGCPAGKPPAATTYPVLP